MSEASEYLIVAATPGRSNETPPYDRYAAVVDHNPFGLHRNHNVAAFEWRDGRGRSLETHTTLCGAYARLMNFSKDDEQTIVAWLAGWISGEYLKRPARIIPVASLSEYLIGAREGVDANPDTHAVAALLDANPFGFTREACTGAWMWVTADGAVMELSPEPPGLQVSFSNTTAQQEEQMVQVIVRACARPSLVQKIT